MDESLMPLGGEGDVDEAEAEGLDDNSRHLEDDTNPRDLNLAVACGGDAGGDDDNVYEEAYTRRLEAKPKRAQQHADWRRGLEHLH